MVVWKIGKVCLIENWMKFILEKFGIPGSDPKGDQGADVAKDSATDLLIKLLNVLVSENQGEDVLSCL